nr:methyltransferase domain-containing protein [Enterobacter roggenkampii]
MTDDQSDTLVMLRLAEAVEASATGRQDVAAKAYLAVLAIDPTVAEAQLGLGLSYMALRRFSDAVDPLRRAARSAGASGLWHACFAQSLYLTGDFAGCDEAFGQAVLLDPLGEEARATWATARCLAAMVDGRVELALAGYAVETGLDDTSVSAFAAEASAILGVFGHTRAAAAVARWRQTRGADDPVTAFRLAALEGAHVDRAPMNYIEAHFDAFADRFDHQLVTMLGYKLPRDLAALLPVQRSRFDAALDLGCGTGLAIEPLAPFVGSVAGVDLSGAMLAKADARGGYERLVRADAVPFLNGHPEAFDLVFAADLLIYFGDLEPLFNAVAGALRVGGCFAFSTERAENGWTLQGSGRFAHADAYVDQLAEPQFERLAKVSTTLRQEGGDGVEGTLHLFARAAS